ncbi:nucleotidyl transferase AbiEii/AbiGii toxin family protein [Novosphingobium panipatense]
MDEFARRPAEDRRAFIDEAAARRDLTPIIIEKDFWVCWTLRRLVMCPDLAGHMTFKGGTSLSKAYGIIARFSEDIDLTISRAAPLLSEVASPMDSDITGKERERRTKALKAAAQAYVATVAMPILAREIEVARHGRGLEPGARSRRQGPADAALRLSAHLGLRARLWRELRRRG